MARVKDKAKAIQLRKQGKSYSEIKERIGVSKSTLSGWLRDYPLSKEDLVRLRDKNPRRIEMYRATMARKRHEREQGVYATIEENIDSLTEREVLLTGLFLYWAEGTKRARYTTALANTDPAMIRFFLRWVKNMGIKKEKLSVRLQLYSDMDIKKETEWWSKELNLSEKYFKKPYVKKTLHKNLTYKTGYGHGTCNVMIHDRDLNDYVMMGVKYLQDQHMLPVEFSER